MSTKQSSVSAQLAVVNTSTDDTAKEYRLPEGRSTRLFGANLFFDNPGAVLDVPVTENQDQLIELWLKALGRILPALNWGKTYQHGHEKYSKGIRFALSSPFDLLWAATDLVEYIWLSVRHNFEFGDFLSLDHAKSHMLPIIEKYTNLVYRKVYAEAMKRRLNVFEDGDKIAIGSGKYAYIVAKDKLVMADIPWTEIHEIPAVMITGTNGKTTTVRLTRFIAKMANKTVGYCSTDWIMIGDEIIEKGDLSGPSGNHGVMMHPDVEVAVLEVARGGLLRRGIATNFVRAATVTNVSEDHMGEDGVDTLEQLACAKALVYKAVAPDGYSIVNLDDSLICEYSRQLTGKKIYITRNIHNPHHAMYIKGAAYVCYTDDKAFYWRDASGDKLIATFADTPITVNGNALHNIENAAHAIALSFALGNTLEQIGHALTQYENSAENNQGRANVFNYNGGKILVDFAHNVAGIDAIIHLAKSYLQGSGRFALLFGNTGNRMYLADKITDVIANSKPDFVIIKEMSSYLRGTEPGQLVKQMEGMLVNKGIDYSTIELVENELDGLDIALKYVKPGDVFLFIAHESITEVIDKLKTVEEQ